MNDQEKFERIQEKLLKIVKEIINDIAQTDGGLERLQMMYENHQKLTKYDLSMIFQKLDFGQ